MLQRVEVEGIKFPRLYIAENEEDVSLARSNGIPYVFWKNGMWRFVRYLLRPTLEKMFPGINWNKVLGKKSSIVSEVVLCPGNIDNDMHQVADYDAEAMREAQYEYDALACKKHGFVDEGEVLVRDVPVAESERDIPADNSWSGYDAFSPDHVSVFEYVGDLSSCVDIEALQKLRLLPKFVGDIADCVKHNLSNRLHWTEGYNKKLGCTVGNFKGRNELPNLIIIDISASIPDGIAATMLCLADTLRSECNADLIITSARSGYYPAGCKLPDVQTLRNYYGRSNEGAEFMAILQNHIAGREWGHVISFGDFDNPGNFTSWKIDDKVLDLSNTKVHAAHHYHTKRSNTRTGYARWVHDACPDAEETFNVSWCNVMNKHYRF